jgi:hypothetical protein
MRKTLLLLCGLASVCVASAQFKVGAFANYSKYATNPSLGTPGVGIRASYEADRIAGVLSFANGFALKEKSSTVVTNNSTFETKSVTSEEKLSFKTITLMGNRTLIGDEETTGKFYFGFGGSFVIAKYSESITESYDKAYTAPEMEKGTESGFVLNGILGGEFKLGNPSLFVEAGYGLPANQVNNAYVENVIPGHLTVNVGIKIPLGGGDY